MIGIIPGIIILLVAIVGSFLCWRYEKRQYNNGFCPACGARWVHFDCDSQGGDGWKCMRCGNGMWTSWIRPKNIYYGRIV